MYGARPPGACMVPVPYGFLHATKPSKRQSRHKSKALTRLGVCVGSPTNSTKISAAHRRAAEQNIFKHKRGTVCVYELR